MARRKTEEDDVVLPPPATTLEGREDQLIVAAYNLVEKRIARGEASAQETVHFLRAGSRQMKEQLQKTQSENEVLKTRVKEMEGRRSQEDLLKRALAAFRGYSGQEPIDDEDDYDENVFGAS